MKEAVSKNLLVRFLKKETTQEENEIIFRWASDSEENREKLKKMHQTFYLSMLKKDLSAIDIEKAWATVRSDMIVPEVKQKLIPMNILQKIAASVLIFLTIGFGGLWGYEHYFRHAKQAIVRLEAPKGEKSKVLLADGTQVWLNSETTLKYNALDPRKVTMEGEAYFEVEKDRKHPFVVTTGSGVKVTVLGTRFNLRSFDDEPFVETTLDEGKVMLTGPGNSGSVILKPGEQASYNRRENNIEVKNVKTEIYSIWKNNELRFSNISFQELVPRIERWYGVTVKLDPSVSNNDRFTMTIKTESLRELLQMMQLTSKFEYAIDGEKVIIRAK